ncbi:MAG TPA: biopolymer transporter ExbD [Bacteroidales bacterium]|nr:MAG: biopolymer transporter ExbD [Bacteroidetes bacterium GWF2_33_38]OFY72548.1 MAG: biopolymer transporter ExbD [Bacteroidetes bacterium RIFOXYA12_FULL_33_9]HBF87008.1 biopolymer transporter ExbD [Bacteroidales bacterium]
MSKFKKKTGSGSQQLSTASLPDIVFMLLFFFMVTTVMRETELFVINKLPGATEIKKLEKKSLVSYIYVGAPRPAFQTTYGTEPKIQLNDQFAKVSDIKEYISQERDARDESEVPLMTTSLKVDEKTKMGIVTEIKQELRQCNALKINYSARKTVKD